VFHGFEDGIDGCFGLGAGETGALDYSLDEILLDQWGRLPVPCPWGSNASAGLL
jgi:hypothetical protein